MERFVKIFIFLQVLVLQFIFITSIYNIYEKNNIIDNGDIAFYLKNPNPNELERIFNFLNEKKIGFEQLRGEPDIKNNINYVIFYSKYSNIDKKSAISRDIKISYKLLHKEDFVDSAGIFYISKDQKNIIKKLNNMYGFNIQAYEEDKISYKNILVVNGINIYFLLIFSVLTYFMYISSDLKKIAIKKLIGFSNFRIVSNYYSSLVKTLGIILILLDVICMAYFAINKSLSLKFVVMLASYSLGIIIINILLMLIALFLIKFIKINEMIKHKNFNKLFNKILILFKWVTCILVSISLIYFTNSLLTLLKEKNDIKNYQKYNNYYTSNGFSSEHYNQLLKNKKELQYFSKNIRDMVKNEESYLLDTSTFDIDNKEIPKFVISNKRFIEEFTQLRDVQGNNIRLTTSKNQVTILIPQKFQSDEDKLKKYFLKNIVNEYINYDKYYGISKKQQKPSVNIQYIENNQGVSFLGEEKFETIKDLILIVDDSNFSGMYYADTLNAGDIYFKFPTREEFQKITVKYNLEQYVVPGTLLTPYLTKIENQNFIFQNVTIFIIIFIFILMFLIYASNQTTILVNRKKYAVQTFLGYSKIKVLKKYVWISTCIFILFLLLAFYNKFSLLFSMIVLIDFFVLMGMYTKFINKSLANSIKGE